MNSIPLCGNRLSECFWDYLRGNSWYHALLELKGEVSLCFDVDLNKSVPSCMYICIRMSSERQN
jgi:hypothetical protein